MSEKSPEQPLVANEAEESREFSVGVHNWRLNIEAIPEGEKQEKIRKELEMILGTVERNLAELNKAGYTVKIETRSKRYFDIIVERGDNSVKVAGGDWLEGNIGTYDQELSGILSGLVEAVKLAGKDKYHTSLTY